MKLNKLSCAIGVACATMAGSAFAIPASSFTAPGGAASTVSLYVSGASAQDNGLLAYSLSHCQLGSVHRYAISNNFVYYCNRDTTKLNLSQNKIAIFKYSAGGSGAGVNQVNNGQTIPFLDLAKLDASCAGPTATATLGTFTYVNVACTAASGVLTTGVVTKVGLSDVEPAFFASAANTNNLKTDPIATLIFGVPVTRNIYKALQTQQGLNTGACTITAPAAVWEYSNECMPSLSRGQLVSAYTQPGQTWGGIGVNTGLGDDTIYVARRVDSSGTQKTFEALVARTPNGDSTLKSCQTGTDPFVQPDSGNTTTGDAPASCTSSVVFAGNGGGDVRNCLIAHQQTGHGAIGILTSEDLAPTNTADTWRFVKVNGGSATQRGAAPVHADVLSGDYTFWTVAALNYLPATLSGSADYNTFVTSFKADLADGLTITQQFGPSGLLANFVSGTPNFATGVINPWNRLVGGTDLNNCQQGKASGF